MRKVRLELSYDGTCYYGWQLQNTPHKKPRPSQPTVQGALEEALHAIFNTPIRVTGSGRTDAGVHALCQVAHCEIPKRFSVRNLAKALNGVLPPDIKVLSAEDAASSFHARYRAVRKTYLYTILNSSVALPIGRQYYYFVPYTLDIARMRSEARFLTGTHDFRALCKHARTKKDTKRTITRMTITRQKPFLHISIEANGFLHGMVRHIIGALIDVGRGKLTHNMLEALMEGKGRHYCVQAAPAKGLFLQEVKY